jgi:hypothetical protein
VAKLFRQDLLQLSEQWMQAARILLAAQSLIPAYQAGGIALECALKARIAKLTQAEEFPDRRLAEKAWKHDPTELLAAGDLVRYLDAAGLPVQANWATVKDWKIESRYDQTIPLVTVNAFLDALDGQPDGILPWLLKHC